MDSEKIVDVDMSAQPKKRVNVVTIGIDGYEQQFEIPDGLRIPKVSRALNRVANRMTTSQASLLGQLTRAERVFIDFVVNEFNARRKAWKELEAAKKVAQWKGENQP